MSNSQNFSDILEAELQIIGQALSLDCIYVFELQTIAQENNELLLKYIWQKRHTKTPIKISKGFRLPINSRSGDNWSFHLCSGQTVSVNIEELCQEQSSLFENHNLNSLLLIPILTGEHFWGTLAFHSIDERDDWHKFEDILKVYAEIVGSMIIRQELDDTLKEHTVNLDKAVKEQQKAELEKQQAEKASQAKSDFLANMSHEIRTPMNAIVGFSDFLMETAVTNEQKQYAQTINSACSSMLGIVNNVLDLSKIESQKLKLETIPFNLSRELEELVLMLYSKKQNPDVELLLHIPADIPTLVNSDPIRLKQILANLVSNALKFTQKGHVLIKVESSTMKSEADTATFTFTVEDTGIGITQDQQRIIFDKYTQASSDISRRFGGTGLGLAICRELVSLLAGSLKLDSTYGQGSKFYFSIELQLLQEKREDISAAHLTDAAYDFLIIHPNDLNSSIIKNYIMPWQFTSSTTSHGNIDAINNSKLSESTIAILDDSFHYDSLQRTINILKQNKTLVGLIHSEQSDSNIKSRLTNFDFYIKKPVTPARLFYSILQQINTTHKTKPSVLIPPASPSQVETNKSPLPIPHILLAEDNPMNQKTLFIQLEKLGFSVDLATNGLEVLDLLEKNPTTYDFVLMDCQMPKLDGYEATRRIRTSKKPYATIPVIAVTAHALREDQIRCVNCGMNDFIAKPVNTSTLEKTIKHVINQN
jgi:signal transduction histidine kinase/CheY-like chemotaxis protein